jgi:Protein of unknown function (DUF3304)
MTNRSGLFASQSVVHACRALLSAMICLTLLSSCFAREPVEDRVGVPMSGLDHLAEHLSIQNFWVDGHHAHQAGKGGRQVCCASLPSKWHPGLQVRVKWGVTNWRDHVFSVHERDVAVDKYDELGTLYIHFLPDGSVRAVTSMYAAWGQGGYYPGPSYDTVLRKQPWRDYQATRPEGMKEFPEVKDAMKDQRK